MRVQELNQPRHQVYRVLATLRDPDKPPIGRYTRAIVPIRNPYAPGALVDIGKPTVTGAVTGGTGAYANARGTVVSNEGPKGSVSTLTLVG